MNKQDNQQPPTSGLSTLMKFIMVLLFIFVIVVIVYVFYIKRYQYIGQTIKQKDILGTATLFSPEIAASIGYILNR